MILGGYSLYLEQEQGIKVIEAFEQSKHAAVIQVITSLPLGKWILPLFFFTVCFLCSDNVRLCVLHLGRRRHEKT